MPASQLPRRDWRLGDAIDKDATQEERVTRPNYRTAGIVALLLAALAPWASLASAVASIPTDVSSTIRLRLENPVELVIKGVVLDRSALKTAYEARNFDPVWTPRLPMEATLIGALATANEDGLDADALGIDAVRAVLADPTVSVAERELLLTDRYLAWARALAQGSIAPSDIETDWILPRPDFDAAAAVAHLVERGDPSAALAALAPRSVQYRDLKAALARYRALAAGRGWQALPIGWTIEPGAAGPSVRDLRERLVAEGDMEAAPSAGDIFDATIGVGVRHFQSRHGLSVDGRVGVGTLQALNVAAADRVEQIRLNLERLRAMPHDWPTTRIEVNVAAASLAFYRDGEPVLTSRVIVGQPDHPTPVLSANANAILLNPPWNVPTSIVRREIQPKLRRDSDYLARNHFVLLGRDGGDPHGGDMDWRKTTILGQGWRLQQEPGPWNSLGRIKIDLPNPFDVYLHDTPAKSLFVKPTRALSHGCVRIDAVHRLAEALLGAAWPAEAIDQAISAGATLRIPLSAPVPVYLLYLTAFVDGDGSVEFRDDIYGRDQRLAAALARLKSGRQPTGPMGPVASTGCPTG